MQVIRVRFRIICNLGNVGGQELMHPKVVALISVTVVSVGLPHGVAG
jgi:hypothetical protein